MMLLCSSVLLLCLSAATERNIVRRESGQNVTFECSSAGCQSSVDNCIGMYLYHISSLNEEVLYCHHLDVAVSLRPKYEHRTHTGGTVEKLSITIGNLTEEDSGLYSCVYTGPPNLEITCDEYMLVVREVTACPRSEAEPPAEARDETFPLVLIIFSTCVISTFITMFFILVVAPKVKRWTGRSRSTDIPDTSNDYVYEVMTKNGLRPPTARD